MLIKFQNHWDSTGPKFIFEHKEKLNPAEAVATFGESLLTDIKIEGMSAEQALKLITEQLDQDEVARLVDDAKAEYEAIVVDLYRKLKAKQINYEETMGEIMAANKEKREKFSTAIQNMYAARGKKEAVDTQIKGAPKPEIKKARIPIVGPMLKGVDVPIFSPILDSEEYRRYGDFKNETNEKFTELHETLSAQYFNMADQDSRYKDLSKGFINGMGKYIENQLEFIYTDSKSQDELKDRLEKLRDSVVAGYKENAGGDGLFDLHELINLELQAKQSLEILEAIKSGKSDEEIAGAIEGGNYFNREAWEESTMKVADSLIKYAKDNGTEAAFIALVKKWTGATKDMNFDDATSEFKDIMERRAKTGVKETIQAIHEFDTAVNGERAEILALNDIKPSIHGMVRREREYLLSQKTIPKNVDDSAVVDFMISDIDGRTKILEDSAKRGALFLAIQNIKKYYPAIYNRDYRKSIPSKTSEMTSSQDPDDPTSFDRIARLLAVLTLAREAEWVVQSLARSEKFKSKNLHTALEATDPERVPPKTDMKFSDPNKLYRTGYVTMAARGGFNGKDLGMSVLKAILYLTMFMNLMNGISKEGLKGAANVATNPFFVGAGVTLWGLKKTDKHPEVAGYFSADAGEGERMMTHVDLTGLAEEEGNVKVHNFINNPDETRVVEAIMQDPKRDAPKIGKLLAIARKENPGKPPVITKKLLMAHFGVSEEFDTDEEPPKESAGTNDSTINHDLIAKLPDRGNDRMRYLFYEKFLTSKKVNTRALYANCSRWDLPGSSTALA